MARPKKNLEALQGAYTKESMKERIEQEERIKGRNDKLVAPEFINLDEVAIRKFEELVNELTYVDVINNVDIDLLAIYCDSWSKYVKATKMLMVQPLVDNVDKSQNPYLKIQQMYSAQMIKISSLFGLSPADRSKIAHLTPSDKNEKKDPLTVLMESIK